MKLVHSKAFLPLLLIALAGLFGTASASQDPGAAFAAHSKVTPTSHPFSTDRVTVKRIYRAKASADRERVVIIKLFNPDHFYVGGLYWVLWVGDKPYDERQCVNETDSPSEQDMRESSTNQTRCFFVPERHWKEFRQGDPLFLTWGRLRAAGQWPFGRLDKRLIKKG